MAWFGSAQSSDAPGTQPKRYRPLAPAPLLPAAANTTLAASTATVAATAAATKVKKKAAAGVPLVTAPAAGVKAAVLPPVSLLGY